MTTPEVQTFHRQALLNNISALVAVRDALNADVREHVLWAISCGATWREVGIALGTSTQAAWSRYRADDDVAISGGSRVEPPECP